MVSSRLLIGLSSNPRARPSQVGLLNSPRAARDFKRLDTMVTGNVIADILQQLKRLRDAIQFLTGNTNRAITLANQAIASAGPFSVVSEHIDVGYDFSVQFPSVASSDIIFVRLTTLTGEAPVSFIPDTDFVLIDAGESAAAKYAAPGACHFQPISVICGVPEVTDTYLTSDVYIGFVVLKSPQFVYTGNGFGDGGTFATPEAVTSITDYFNIRHCRYS